MPARRLRRDATVLVVALAFTGCFSEVTTSGGSDTAASDPPRAESSTDAGETASNDAGETSHGDVDETSSDVTTSLPMTTDSSSGEGESDACGDGELGADEQCDGGPGCVDCSLEHYPCNPANQVGCAAGVQTCDRTRGATLDDQRTGCFQRGLALWGDACTYNPIDPAMQCADGLSCVGAAYHPSCAAAECCTQFCDLTDATTCPDPSTVCLTWKEPGMPPGLDTLGLCIRL